MGKELVVGILDIVEAKLREFGIQIPDECREDSTDSIVGYTYAELHDLIQEYLEEEGVLGADGKVAVGVRHGLDSVGELVDEATELAGNAAVAGRELGPEMVFD